MKLGQQIGRGAFSRVYQHPDKSDSVLILSRCHAKECMAYGWMDTGRRMPKIKQIKYNINDRGESLYLMPKYERVRAPSKELSKVDFAAYQSLKALAKEYNPCENRPRDLYRIAKKVCSNKSLADQIGECCEGMANYTDRLGFEVSPRNIAKRKSGGVVWLDLFFNIDQLMSQK